MQNKTQPRDLCSKQVETREWQVGLMPPSVILGTTVPLRDDNPTLTGQGNV